MSDPDADETTATCEGPSRVARFEDAIVGAVAIAIAGALYWRTFYFRAVDWTPLGLAFWPRVVLVGIVLAACALVLLRQLDTHPAVRVTRPETTLLAAIAGLVIALPVLGFFVTGFIYTFGTMIWLQGVDRRPTRAVLLAAATTATTFAVFGLGLNVPLPTGILGDVIGGR